MRRTRRLCSCPMKSHWNSSPWAATLACRSCARFSPTRRMPASASSGRSPRATYLVAASISTSCVPGAAAPGGRRATACAISFRSRSRFSRTVWARRPVISSAMGLPPAPAARSAQPYDARLAPGELSFAAMREEARVADRAYAERPHIWHARRAKPPLGRRRQVDRPAARLAAEREVHLVADLITAGPGAGPDHGLQLLLAGEVSQRPHALLENAGGEAAPAGVQHRHGAGPGNRDG